MVLAGFHLKRMPITCFHRFWGEEGRLPLVILHGLLGSSRNWAATGRDLARYAPVYALDARNHGESPWDSRNDYEAMASDLLQWADSQGFAQMILLGHSMGGKTAMRFACRYPERLAALIVADIAPLASAPRWVKPFEALVAIDPAALAHRAEADEALAQAGIANAAFRGFLLTNLQRRPDGRFAWQANIRVLKQHLPLLFANPLHEGDCFDKPVLVVRGQNSDFLTPERLSAFEPYFPDRLCLTIQGAGHNVHIDNRPAFVEAVAQFVTALQMGG